MVFLRQVDTETGFNDDNNNNKDHEITLDTTNNSHPGFGPTASQIFVLLYFCHDSEGLIYRHAWA